MNRPKSINSILAFCFALLAMTSCTSNEIGNSKDVNPDAVFFDYTVLADEGGENVTVNLQYRMGGKNGTTLVLDEPSKVLLDGEQLKVDSAKINGAYYEIQKPIASFAGKHMILLPLNQMLPRL
jgi:hypothetical protein